MTDEEGSGRPSSSTTEENVQAATEMTRSYRSLTIPEVPADLSIPHGSVQRIVTTELKTSYVSAKFVLGV